MAIDFPASPTNGQTFTVGSVTYTWDGTKWTAVASGGAAVTDKIEEGNTSAEVIDTGSDGRFVVTTEGTERLRVDSSGKVGVGTTSPVQALHTVGSATTYVAAETTGTGTSAGFRLKGSASADYTIYTTQGVNQLAVYDNVAGAERMRITSDGNTVFGSTGSIALDAHKVIVYPDNGTSGRVSVIGDGSSGGALFLGLTKTGPADRFIVRCDGDVENTNNSYGGISDIKLKENIVDASSQWADIKALQVRNYNFKDRPDHRQIGLIAQEAELVSPGIVSESPDLNEEGNETGEVTKSVNYSVLYMKAVKALQEAMERIETLEAKVAALEAS